ncbi:MAG: DUF2306 domain-containing protein [Chitinophagaceae bacterium]|nr:MAG: DUF2306 domain-containing protein [Chitinophagaceae bacterium]
MIAHIFFGGISLVIGLFILLIKKGDKRHKSIGNIFFYAMILTVFSAFIMTYLRPNYFLFIVGVFTAYMLLSGKRYLKKKKITDVKHIDWLLTFIMLLFGAAFIAFGFYLVFKSNFFGIVFLVFGVISLVFVYQDYLNFKGKAGVKNYWLVTHFQRMIGSYIATITAFLVVNNTFLPGVIAWLLPTAILVPLIIFWSRKYEIKHKKLK